MNIHSGDRDLPEIFAAQNALKLLNVYFLGIDGIFGPGTAKAVAAFQHQKQITVTGELDKTTFDLLIEAQSQLQQAPPLPSIEWPLIEAAYAEKGYPMHQEQYKINLLGIRRDDIFDNTFSDRLVIFWKNEKMDWEMRQFEWTTMPGTEGKGGVFNPL
ncbi:MAG: peptidoglycan-binding domain-containing protein, partial [Bacteroidota bacterium]